VDLSGGWRAALRSLELEREGADPELDDRSWPEVPVPGHWGESPAFADSAGAVLYRRHFTAPRPVAGRRAWLRIDGVMSEADVWLDGHHLGDTNVYYAGYRFDITDQLIGPDSNSSDANRADSEHVLAIEVACADSPASRAKSSVNGTLQSGSLAPPGSPGGIWRSIGVDETGPVAIVSDRLLCTKADDHEAELLFHIELDAASAGEVRIDTSIVGPDGSTAGGIATHAVASGLNQLEWTAVITDPALWWPAALGDQPRYDVGVAVRLRGSASDRDAGEETTVADRTGEPDGSPDPRDTAFELSDRRHWRTGLRAVAIDDMTWRINGRSLFVKGIAVGPHNRFLGSVPPHRFVEDVRAVRDAGLDMIRVYGHLSRTELYDAADDLGILIWQDLPLVGTYATSARTTARLAARAAVDAYGHHPSVVAWCGHDEPNGPPIPEPGSRSGDSIGRRLGRHLLPSWNRSVLDPLVRRELRSADESRPVITRSGSLPTPIELARSDSHLWLGWRGGKPEDLAELVRRWPRLGTFVGAIGAQSATIRRWGPDEPTWATAERGSFQRYVPRGAYGDGVSWAAATQAYQADVIRTQIETLRRLKYNPTGGFCVVSLFDAEPSGGFGVLDAERNPKPAFTSLTDACRPVVVIADSPPGVVTKGDTVTLAVHAVSDLAETLKPVRVTATARLEGWSVEQRWEGVLPADVCAFIGELSFAVPDLTGALVIDLELTTGEHLATNRYQTVAIPPSETFSPRITGPNR
jgi:beta-mannosidase